MTNRQKRFVEEYLIDLNATQAAIRAGYSTKRASELGYQLLRKTTVQAEIARQQQEQSKRTEITQDYVIEHLRELAEKAKAESVRVKSLELLGKHIGMFRDRVEVTGKDGSPLIPIPITTVREGVGDSPCGT